MPRTALLALIAVCGGLGLASGGLGFATAWAAEPASPTAAASAANPPAQGSAVASTAPPNTSPAAAQKIDFVRDVQPLLKQHCYECHAGKKHEGGLQWDQRASVLKGGDSGKPVLVAGDPEKSLVVRLVRRVGDDAMPPDGEGTPVPAAGVAILTRWIAEGAQWPDAAAGEPLKPKHWAFIPPVRPALPIVKQADWPRDPMDKFVLARLEKEGLRPSPEADRYTLARRVYLDLIGIPPTPAEVDAFVHDSRPDAYERLVDQLLASPHYGERWARMWLDLARYADTQGYEKDNRRTIWRYRDWVIDAFNRDLPYDRFTIEQIAGDLLPSATMEQMIATAFHRNTMTNTEGGTDDEEFRTAAVVDRTNTTGQVWMGLTVGCAQCHSHKYDPITQRDYYRLFAMLNQTEDSDKDDERPTLPTPLGDSSPEVAKLNADIVAEQLKLTQDTPQIRAGQTAWEKHLLELSDKAAPEFGPWHVIGPFPAANLTAAHTTAFPPEQKIDLKANYEKGKLKWISRPEWKDAQSQLLSKASGAWYLTRTIEAPSAMLIQLSLGSGHGIKLAVNNQLLLDHQIVRPAAPNQEYVTARLQPGTNVLLMKISHSGNDEAEFFFRADQTGLPPELSAAIRIAPERRTTRQNRELARYYRQVAPELEPVQLRIAQLMQEKATFLAAHAPTTPIMRELPPDKQRKTNVLIRGNFLSKGAEVQPGVPEAFPPLPSGAPANRLGLAMWLVARDNPLTARVLVNRFWEQLFGTGLVMTAENFGTQGTLPSHPELLDYMAVETMDQGWSMKKLLRRLVLSATYRQSSRVTPELLSRDRDNRLLARGPRFRLEAEMVRDQALAASGLLSGKMFGASVMPPQPEGVWQVVYNNNERWQTSAGEDRYRRGLYTFWRRTSPYPSMMAFDAVSREVCTVRRIRTNTPLAALVTLNDPVYIESAQALARMAIRDGGSTPADRVTFAFRRCLVRPPRPEEVKRLVDLYQTQLQQYRTDIEAAKKLIANGGALPPGTDAAEMAAWTVVGNVIMNLDEMLSKT
ncbi:MAG: PSD1 and planctomycete cytochrome C domain-containing protein [Planctomycetia bacterium]|nr:PSD1 and planctomycete cytochrome C domain-containing protein [Planctomycetia bacterium]